MNSYVAFQRIRQVRAVRRMIKLILYELALRRERQSLKRVWRSESIRIEAGKFLAVERICREHGGQHIAQAAELQFFLSCQGIG